MRSCRAASVLALLLAGSSTLEAQSILTIAGGGTDDGRSAANASLRVPFGVALDAAGNLYIADTFDHRIRRVDAGGRIETVAGTGERGFSRDGGPATLAGFNLPEAVSVDGSRLLVADTDNQRIRSVDLSSGVVVTIAGKGPGENGLGAYSGDGGPATAAELNGPAAAVADAAGNVYLSDRLNHRIRRVDGATGLISTVAQLDDPRGLALAGDALLVADSASHRVRKLSLTTGGLTTVAGSGSEGSDGDGGPALSASLSAPWGIALDPAGNLLVADRGAIRVRRIDAVTGVITTVAGNGSGGFAGDGAAATAASLAEPRGVAVDAGGTFYVADTGNNRVRRVRAGVISTVAGSGTRGLLGDGGPATFAGLAGPTSLALDASGGLVIADEINHRVRRVSLTDGLIATLAGTGEEASGPDGAATGTAVARPFGVAAAPDGVLFLTDTFGNKVRRLDRGGTLTTVGGTGERGTSGDGGPATAARFDRPGGLALDASGGLFVTDGGNRVRRVAAGLASTVAGRGTVGDAGDGGPATQASLGNPLAVAADTSGNLFIADTDNHRVRRVDALTGVVQGVAGTGVRGSTGDGGPATAARLGFPKGVALDTLGNLLIGDTDNNRVRRVDGATGTMSTIAGGRRGFSGDGGPALEAGLQEPYGPVADARGNVYIADKSSNRVRVVYACTGLATPSLEAPADGEGVATRAPVLRWSAIPGAFAYDVYLDTVNPPARLVAVDVSPTTPTPFVVPPGTSYSFAPANLEGGKTHYWRVVAKGDPFCAPRVSAGSALRSFTTAAECSAPGAFRALAPGEGGEVLPGPVTLSWEEAAGAGSYDVYLGGGDAAPLRLAGVRGTSVTIPDLRAGTGYTWSVVARASCDGASTTASPARTFRVAGSCQPPGAFSTLSPPSGAPSAKLAELRWSASDAAAAYDLYLGTTDPPPLRAAGLATNGTVVADLLPGTLYHWRVVATSACGTAETPMAAFQVLSCQAAQLPYETPAILSAPGRVPAGRTYTLSWSAVPGVTDAGYLVERSSDETFTTLLDRQKTALTTASFLARGSGLLYHRVRASVLQAVPREGGTVCEAVLARASATTAVTIAPEEPMVVFSAPPQAALTQLSEPLELFSTRFTLESLGEAPLTVHLGALQDPRRPFFRVVDPEGRGAAEVTLAARTPRTLELRYSGPPSERTGSFDGLLYLNAELAAAAFATSNLKVGASSGDGPQFTLAGSPVEQVAFPGYAASDDATRPPLVVGVHNAGASPLDLGAEVGPEVWLVPEAGWNETSIPPGATRQVKLFTDRRLAPAEGGRPRHTYFTVRTRDGRTARLLVEDPDAPAVAAGRTPLAPEMRSYIVPSAVHATSRIGNTFTSRLRIASSASEPVQAELVFTPSGADGFDAGTVRRASVVVPPGDAVVLTDPLISFFGLDAPIAGPVEVRAAAERIGQLTVTSLVDAPGSGGGVFGFQLPTFARGDGARLGSRYAVPGLTSSAAYRTNLILAETTGIDAAEVRVRVFDGDGAPLGVQTLTVPRYGQRQISGVAAGEVHGGFLEVEVISGGGSVASLVTVIDNSTDDSVTYQGRPSGEEAPSGRPGRGALAPTRVSAMVPAVVNGFPTFRGRGDLPYTFRSLMGFTNARAEASTVKLRYLDLERQGTAAERTLTVPARRTVELPNLLEQLFDVGPGARSQGPLFLEMDSSLMVYAKVYSNLESGSLGDSFPVVPLSSDALTGAGYAKPVLLEGLEQSLDFGRGTRSNLILNELTGKPATVLVRLYEAGNRAQPIAERELSLKPLEKLQLSTVFESMGLSTRERAKDRTNVLCLVTWTGGEGLVSAVVTTIDNQTGDTRNALMTPVGGTGVGTIGF